MGFCLGIIKLMTKLQIWNQVSPSVLLYLSFPCSAYFGNIPFLNNHYFGHTKSIVFGLAFICYGHWYWKIGIMLQIEWLYNGTSQKCPLLFPPCFMKSKFPWIVKEDLTIELWSLRPNTIQVLRRKIQRGCGLKVLSVKKVWANTAQQHSGLEV